MNLDAPLAHTPATSPAAVPDGDADGIAVRAVGAALAASALSACGGGGGSSSNTSSTTTTLPASSFNYPTAQTDAEASRFLLQAQFSASDAEIASVRSLGYTKWLENQLAQPMGQTGWDWLNSKGYDNPLAVKAAPASGPENFFDNSSLGDYMVWNQLLAAPDAARKRMALALSEIFVVSLNSLDFSWRSHAAAHYWDTLCTHAFGNYRNLLEAITLNVAMGYYLNTKGNKKADGRGSQPDENYAREVMQLFTIGLVKLNPDGTPQLVGGNTVESYTAADVSALANVFTGYDLDQRQNVPTVIGARTVPSTHFARLPMIQTNNGTTVTSVNHSTVSPTFLDTTVPAAAAAGLQVALNTLFNHANTAPFICKQLIQRLVTSNPSPAYVQRVANAFINNGSGVRGDLAVVYATILRDDEARGPAGLTAPEFGKLREPMVRMVQWARTFGVTSASGAWKVSDQSNPGSNLGQSPLRSGSVFNFFRPGYVPPATALSAGAVAPEFQLVNESSVGGYINFMRNTIDSGLNSSDLKAAYTTEIALAMSPTRTNPSDLVNRLNLLLCGGQLSASNLSLITNAVGAMAPTGSSAPVGNNLRNRVCAAVLLVMASAEYLAQK